VEYIPYGEVFVNLIRDKDQDNFIFKIKNIIYKDGKLFGENSQTGNYDVPAPREINKLLENPQLQKAIQKSKEYLGE
jgi:hypothetical protein